MYYLDDPNFKHINQYIPGNLEDINKAKIQFEKIKNVLKNDKFFIKLGAIYQKIKFSAEGGVSNTEENFKKSIEKQRKLLNIEEKIPLYNVSNKLMDCLENILYNMARKIILDTIPEKKEIFFDYKKFINKDMNDIIKDFYT